MQIGNKILELRKKNNLSQEQLADKIGVARQTISKWELGETYPDLEQSQQLSQLFEVSLDDLTNNDIKSVLITKVTNTEKLTKSIINVLKIILLFIIIISIVLVSIIFFREYFDVQPSASMQSIECTVEGNEYSYEVWINNETPYIIDKIITFDNNLNVDATMYTNIQQVLNAIKTDVTSRGGTCK
ncbi:MAG: helix-turn-helix transcriptional regulator [Firmicutes bacterium]|nr:helix-turn-helix transcriptional regulator [Bacillota bacterium]